MKMPKKFFLKIVRWPIVKIIAGGVLCILIPILINKPMLDNLLELAGLDENVNRGIRVFITTFILMPFFYFLLFRKLEQREITELKLKNAAIPTLIWFLLSVGIITLCFIIPLLTGFFQIESVQTPRNITVNIILMVSLVITEELFFRAILYRILEERWGTIAALSASSVLFALMHLSNENTSWLSFMSIIAGSCVLGISYTYTKSIIVPIAFHFGWNLSQVFLGFGLSGGSEFRDLYVLKLKLSGSEIVTGGTSGIENSLFSILSLILIFLFFLNRSTLVKSRMKN